MIVNFGSLLAVFIIYWKFIMQLFKNGIHYVFTKRAAAKNDFHYIFLLGIATIPAGVIGLVMKDTITSKLSSIETVGITLLLTAGALWYIRKLTGHKEDDEITTKDAILIGLAQSIALVPGISRSGATIVCAMLLGMKRKTALRFSFLMYIPVSLGVSIVSIKDIIHDTAIGALAIPYIFAFIASLLASIFALKWFIHMMEKGKLVYFAMYCFILGIGILTFIGK